jgi:hypothetical protein
MKTISLSPHFRTTMEALSSCYTSLVIVSLVHHGNLAKEELP